MHPVRFQKIFPGRIAIIAALLLSASCRPDTSTDILPEINFLISIHPDVSEGLLGYWPLDGNTKNYGSTGAAADATVNFGAPYPCADRRGNPGAAYCFAGADAFSIPYNAQLDFDTHQDFTVSAWARIDPSSIPGTTIIGYDCGFSPRSFLLEFSSGSLISGSRTDGISTPTVSSNFGYPADNLYRHYLFMKAGSQLLLYVNGALSASAPDTTTATTLYPASLIYMGYCSSNLYGAIDEVRIYNRTLTDREIKILYSY